MDKAGISRAIEALLRKNLAERHIDPAHARRRIVAITPAGRRTMKRVLPFAMRERASILRLLSANERTVLDSAFAKLTAALLEGIAAEPAARAA